MRRSPHSRSSTGSSSARPTPTLRASRRSAGRIRSRPPSEPAMTRQIGIALTQFRPDHPFTPGEIRDYAQRAEAACFDHLWTMDILQTTAAGYEPFELLAFAAGCTERVRLGVMTLV